MTYSPHYATSEPQRSEIDALKGAALLEFGSNWCGHCRRAAPLVQEALTAHPEVEHIKVEDGSGKPLGRSFRVKLWPTLIFLEQGKEVSRLVRPTEIDEIRAALRSLAAPSAT
jgi:thioredoxin 1